MTHEHNAGKQDSPNNIGILSEVPFPTVIASTSTVSTRRDNHPVVGTCSQTAVEALEEKYPDVESGKGIVKAPSPPKIHRPTDWQQLDWMGGDYRKFQKQGSRKSKHSKRSDTTERNPGENQVITRNQFSVLQDLANKHLFETHAGLPSLSPTVCYNCGLEGHKVNKCKRKDNKFAKANLQKLCDSIVPSAVSKSPEPDPHVGPSVPHQYALTPCDPINLSSDKFVEVLKSIDGFDPNIWVCKRFEYDADGKIVKQLFGTQNVDNFDRREFFIPDHAWKWYTYPFLDFIGLWNSSIYSSTNYVHAEHLGIHVHFDDIKIRLPKFLIFELCSVWATLNRDMKRDNYNLVVARCKNLMRSCAVSPEEQYIANLYGPSLAYILSWETEQQVSRVTFRRYSNQIWLTESIRKAISFLQKTKWSKLLLVSVGSLGSLFICYRVLKFLFSIGIGKNLFRLALYFFYMLLQRISGSLARLDRALQ